MNLENVTAALRPRGEWEAADFGVRLVRRDAAAIYRVWFAITGPFICLALLAIAYSPFPGLVGLLYWWLEPVADGPILRIVSRRLFGEDAQVRSTLRSTLSLVWRNRLFLFTPYRFHLARSTAMPVTQLEGLHGPARSARAKVLNQKIFNHGMGVTVAYQHLLLSLFLGIVLIVFWLVPTEYQGQLGESWLDLFWSESGRPANAVALLVFYAAQSALQPWFVGAGFGLYINCRTQLEAWDIEVAFRRMVQRRATNTVAAIVALCLIVPSVLVTETSRAEEPAPNTAEETGGDPGFPGFWSDDEIARALGTVAADEAMQTTREVEEWTRIDPEPEPREERVDAPGWLDHFIASLARLVSFIVEFGLWIAVGLLVAVLFATRRQWLGLVELEPEQRHPGARIRFADGEVAAGELPDDIPGEVLRLWKDGCKRQALSLFYRGAAFTLVTRYGVRLPDSATEGECVDAVSRQADADLSRYFDRIVTTWVMCAYGKREPDDGTLLDLCEEWPQHYGGRT